MNSIIFLLVIYISSICFLRIRNKEYFGLKRQLTDFSTFLVPFNIPAYLFSKIPTTHKVSLSCFPELKILENNWEDIRDEALVLFESGCLVKRDDEFLGSSFYGGNRWTSFYLKAYEKNMKSAYELAPKTMSLIEQVPSMHMAMFACLNPGKLINHHHDPFSHTLRYSLGLSTPNSDASGIVINGENFIWSDGEGIAFDATYFHRAYNNSKKPRIILVTDLERPLKFKWLQSFYYRFGRYLIDSLTFHSENNKRKEFRYKFVSFLLKYRKFLINFKAKNKQLYTVSKLFTVWSVLVLLVYILL